MNMEAVRHTALTAVIAVFISLAPAPACAQGELERLGGGPGGVPQGNPRQSSFFDERAGTHARKHPAPPPSPVASPAAPAPEPDDATADAPAVEWSEGLLSVDCERVPAGDFLIEFNRQTGIPVRLEPGVKHRVTATFRNLRLERALPLLLPAGSWQLVRKPNTALRASDAIAGLVVHPPSDEGTGPAPYAKAKVGGMNFGPAFEVPGESPRAPQPAAVGGIAVEESELEGGRSPASAPSVGAGRSPASMTPGSPAAGELPAGASAPTAVTASDVDGAKRRIADLVEQKLKRKR